MNRLLPGIPGKGNLPGSPVGWKRLWCARNAKSWAERRSCETPCLPACLLYSRSASFEQPAAECTVFFVSEYDVA